MSVSGREKKEHGRRKRMILRGCDSFGVRKDGRVLNCRKKNRGGEGNASSKKET